MQVEMISTAELRYGHDPAAGENINARATDRDDGVAELAASIAAFGLIVPLVGVEREGKVYIVDGNRRLKALLELEDRAVPVHVIQAEDGLALEASLAANLLRKPLHPVDEYECFASINKPPEQIAKEFGRTVLQVRQALALGALSPKVRQAWRAGKLTREAAGAFTLAPEFKTQERVLGELLKQNERGVSQSWLVRRALKLEGGDAAKFVNLIGVDEFERRGGKLIRDLFEDRHIVLNPDLARQLAEDMIAAKIAEEIDANGWAWGEQGHRLPEGWRHTWGRLHREAKPTKAEEKELKQLDAVLNDTEGDEHAWDRADAQRKRLMDVITLRSISAEDRKRSGVVIELTDEGTLEYFYGVLRPADIEKQDRKSAQAPDKPKKPAEGVSRALMTKLQETLTFAASDAAKQAEPATVLALLIASVNSGSPVVAIEIDGLKRKREGLPVKRPIFESAFAHALSHKWPELQDAVAIMVAQSFNFTALGDTTPPLKHKSIEAVCAALPGDAMVARLLHHFDAKDYFERVPLDVVRAAIVQMRPEHDLKGVQGKAAFVKIAVREQKATGWLPPELRVNGYAVPARIAKPKRARKAKA